MSGAKSGYLKAAVLNNVLRATNYSPPTTVYLSLWTASPGEAGSPNNEVTGGSYARVAVTFNAPASGVCTNSGAITFAAATADWGDVSHFGLHDALSGGNLLYHAAWDATKAVNNGDTAQIADTALSVSET